MKKSILILISLLLFSCWPEQTKAVRDVTKEDNLEVVAVKGYCTLYKLTVKPVNGVGTHTVLWSVCVSEHSQSSVTVLN